MHQLVIKHQSKEKEEEPATDTDSQLKKVEEFVNDLTQITNEISRSEGYIPYAPPSSS